MAILSMIQIMDVFVLMALMTRPRTMPIADPWPDMPLYPTNLAPLPSSPRQALSYQGEI